MVPTTPTDADLLRRYLDGPDNVAFGELVQRYLGLVYHAAARQLGTSSHLAEDVTQKVFALLVRKADSLTNHPNLAGWLYKTARNATNETLRTENRRKVREHETYSIGQIEHGGTADANSIEWARMAPVIDEALEELDVRDREVVLLRYFADLSHAQVGNRLAISENAARMRVERALEKLQGALKRRGITSTAVALGVTLSDRAVATFATVPTHLALNIAQGAFVGGVGLAAATAGTKTGVFTLIMSSKITSLIASAVAVFALGFSVYQYHAASVREGEVAAIRQEQTRLLGELQLSEQHRAQADRRVARAENRMSDLQNQLAGLQAANAAAVVPPRPSEASTQQALIAQKLAQMKPLLEAGQPITGGVVVYVDGQPVTREVAFVIGKETRIEGVDDGSYIVLPTLNDDGSVRYKLTLASKTDQTRTELLANIIQTPWSGFAITSRGGKVFAFDPDEKGPAAARLPAPSMPTGPR